MASAPVGRAVGIVKTTKPRLTTAQWRALEILGRHNAAELGTANFEGIRMNGVHRACARALASLELATISGYDSHPDRTATATITDAGQLALRDKPKARRPRTARPGS